MNKAQIKHMVDRFLGWKLPANFSPDAGISFKAAFNEQTPYPMRHEPSGTNLFDATQAEAMVLYLLEGMPADFTEETCPGHVTSGSDPKVCGRCGTHIDVLRPDDSGDFLEHSNRSLREP